MGGVSTRFGRAASASTETPSQLLPLTGFLLIAATTPVCWTGQWGLSGMLLVEPIECEGVYEYPMTVFQSGTVNYGIRRLRHVPIGRWKACSGKRWSRGVKRLSFSPTISNCSTAAWIDRTISWWRAFASSARFWTATVIVFEFVVSKVCLQHQCFHSPLHSLHRYGKPACECWSRACAEGLVESKLEL